MKSNTWLDWFLAQPQSRFFVKIDEEFISNIFNFYGIKQKINHFQAAYELLRKNYVPPSHASIKLESEVSLIEQQTANLYGLLHSRYLMTPKGMKKIYSKYKKNIFPHCPRVLCKGSICIPYGVSYDLCEHPVKLFCPNCSDVYNVKDTIFSKVDGAFFGNAWIPIFLQKYKNEIVPDEVPVVYVPRIFGFKVCLDREDEKKEESNQ